MRYADVHHATAVSGSLTAGSVIIH